MMPSPASKRRSRSRRATPRRSTTSGSRSRTRAAFDEALDYYDRVLAINESVPVVLLNRGVCLARLERLREAVEAFSRALDIDPRDVAAWHNKGLALGRLGQDDEAKVLLRPGTCAIRPAGVAGGAALRSGVSSRSAATVKQCSLSSGAGTTPSPIAKRTASSGRPSRQSSVGTRSGISPRLTGTFAISSGTSIRPYRDRLKAKVAEHLLGSCERALLLCAAGGVRPYDWPCPRLQSRVHGDGTP